VLRKFGFAAYAALLGLIPATVQAGKIDHAALERSVVLSEIQNTLFGRYAMGIDYKDKDLFLSAITDDYCYEEAQYVAATIAPEPVCGHAAVLEFLRFTAGGKDIVPEPTARQTHHMFTNVYLKEYKGDAAVVGSFCTAATATPAGVQSWVGGRCETHFRRSRDGAWRVARQVAFHETMVRGLSQPPTRKSDKK